MASEKGSFSDASFRNGFVFGRQFPKGLRFRKMASEKGCCFGRWCPKTDGGGGGGGGSGGGGGGVGGGGGGGGGDVSW